MKYQIGDKIEYHNGDYDIVSNVTITRRGDNIYIIELYDQDKVFVEYEMYKCEDYDSGEY